MPTRRHRSVRFLQGLGCACLIVMVLTHVAERLHLLPGMGVACWRIRVGFWSAHASGPVMKISFAVARGITLCVAVVSLMLARGTLPSAQEASPAPQAANGPVVSRPTNSGVSEPLWTVLQAPTSAPSQGPALCRYIRCRPGARKKNPAGAGLSDSRSPACRRHEAEVHETIGSQPLRIR
jgi:hypothetical protein